MFTLGVKLVVGRSSDLRKAELLGLSLLGWRYELFCEKSLLCVDGEREKFPLFRQFPLELLKDPFPDRFTSFLLDDWFWRWSKDLPSSGRLFLYPICEVWFLREILVIIGGISPKPVVIIVVVSSLENLTSSPSLRSMIWSSFLVVVLSEVDFFLSSSFIFNSLHFFITYLLSTPGWCMSVRTTVVAKSYCILSSFLVGVSAREFPSTALTGCSCSSDRIFFISWPKVAIWASVCSSSFKKLEETRNDTSLCIILVEKSFHVAFGFSIRSSYAFRCRYLGLSPISE